MALNDSCHLLIETKHHFIQKSGGLEPLSPIASAATATTSAFRRLPTAIAALNNVFHVTLDARRQKLPLFSSPLSGVRKSGFSGISDGDPQVIRVQPTPNNRKARKQHQLIAQGS